jgi:hypothetical protein
LELSAQSFLLANYEPSATPGLWDDIYGEGLLIWHSWSRSHPEAKFNSVVDLESAEKKLNEAGEEDPVNGKDPLERDWCFAG